MYMWGGECGICVKVESKPLGRSMKIFEMFRVFI